MEGVKHVGFRDFHTNRYAHAFILSYQLNRLADELAGKSMTERACQVGWCENHEMLSVIK